MLLVYILLAIIAVGVLLLSPQGQAILTGAGYLAGALLGIAALVGTGVFLYWFIPWMNEGGSAQTAIQIAFGVGLLALLLGNAVKEAGEEYRREGWGWEHFWSQAKSESREVIKEGSKALKTILKRTAIIVGVFIATMLLVALVAWVSRI
jgi:hypothetical protein